VTAKNLKKQINAVELFCGIGGFRLATDQLNIKTVWSNDIDDKACKVYKDKFGEKELVQGDINMLIDKVPKHDMLTAGFPCQPFSSAGKKKGIQDSRGTLFEAIIKILKIHKPQYFVLENVKRLLEMDSGKHFATILSALSELDYLIEWRLLNTMYFGLPQNRARIIITGKSKEKTDIPGQYAVLANEVELKKAKGDMLLPLFEWKKIVNHDKGFPQWGVAYGGNFFGCNLYEFQEASPRSSLKNFLEKNVDGAFLLNDVKGRLENSVLVDKFVGGTHVLYNQRGGARMGYTIFGTSGLAPTLTSSTSRHYERYKVEDIFRRLTNVEYARIQGFPDDHCSAVSVYDQYKLYGNAVAPTMVGWAINKLIGGNKVKINI